MITLKETIERARANKTAVGHFNVSDLAALRAIFEAARKLEVPVIIGVSEGEREFIDPNNIARLVQGLRERYKFPIFLNADHCRSLESVKIAVDAGFDSIIFDGANFPFEENIKKTKEAVDYVEATHPEILVEGELGYIGTSSSVMENIPEGAVVEEKDLPTAELVKEFVEKTRVDLFAPAVGNIHGMFKNMQNPKLHIARIKEIKEVVNVPLVLHGGSGLSDEDFRNAISEGMSVVHINTELRKLWREELEESLKENPNEVAPYKLFLPVVFALEELVTSRLKLFSNKG
ncbi:MAG: class II fructose-bisphosphate aldolase [bacterium]|nr:class II fructose-bisphosphate aldolase [bacterium]